MDETKKGFSCPVCGKIFEDVHTFASHIKTHSDEAKKREEEENKRRLEDQKKVDKANLEKLKKISEDAYSAYITAKEKYIEKYNENYPIEFDLDDFLSSIWNRWH